MNRAETCLYLLQRWSENAELFWYPLPDAPQLGCYGTGYNDWGVQTNQKYLGAMAALSVLGERAGVVPAATCQRARERAVAALRYSLRSHVSGDYRRTDGTQWGHTWISSLGLERMMYGIYLLEPFLTEGDRSGLRRVLTSEADWVLYHHQRGQHQGVFADPWNHTGKNAPESNLWNGAVMWRAAMMYPDHPHAAAWQEQAHCFLMNAISVAADAQDDRLVAGKPVREWHVGANFFPHYALDHHGYLNVGYMVICLSNVAMLHFDMQALGLPAPESLYHHSADLWQILRKMIFSDGRLARIGGDSRIRYTYCQEYLLPTLAYVAAELGEEHAAHLLDSQLCLIEQEAAYSGDGSFYGKRLAPLIERSPYYYTRLEADRACVLGMLATYLLQSKGSETWLPNTRRERSAAVRAFEHSVSGLWHEPEHGAALHRSPSRLASFAWRAHGLTQALCQPPNDGHLAEWPQNLCGFIRFLGDPGVIQGTRAEHRSLQGYHLDTFESGFVTCGAVLEGVNITIEEGWRGEKSALHQIAFAALPDAHTVIGFQHCRTADHRTYVAEVKGLHLNLPNDLYNAFQRRLISAQGELLLASPAERDEVVPLHSSWANIDGRLGVVGLYGADQLVVDRSAQRRGGRYQSLYVEEICYHHATGTRAIDPNTTILDVGWAVLSTADDKATLRFAQEARVIPLPDSARDVRAVCIRGMDGQRYIVLANLAADIYTIPMAVLLCDSAFAQDLASGEILSPAQKPTLALAPGRAYVIALREGT